MCADTYFVLFEYKVKIYNRRQTGKYKREKETLKMKLQFKYQKFQADAAKAVADVFDGQPYLAPSYMTGEISGKNSSSEERKGTFSGWSNQKMVPEFKR